MFFYKYIRKYSSIVYCTLLKYVMKIKVAKTQKLKT